MDRKADRYAYIAAFVAVIGIGSIAAFLYPLQPDLAWLLYAASRAMDGARLYVDVVEINPPLILYIHLLTEWISRGLGIWNATAYRASMLVCVGVSLLLSARLVWKLIGADRGLVRYHMLLSLGFVLVALPAFDFGEREHLAVTLTLPYVLAAAARRDGVNLPRGLAAVIGLLAGIGVGLKPYFLLLPVTVELYLYGARNWCIWVRTEAIWLVGTLAGYLIAVMIFTPDFFPFARWAVGVYTAYGTIARTRFFYEPTGLLVIAATFAHLATQRRSSLRPLRSVLFFAMLAFFGAAVIQAKPWLYHRLPAFALAVLLLNLVAVDAVTASTVYRRCLGTARTALVAVLLLFIAFGTARGPLLAKAAREYYPEGESIHLAAFSELIARHAADGSIFAIHNSLSSSFPLVNYTGVRWASRFNVLWILPGLYRAVPVDGGAFPYRTPEEMGAIERYMIDAVVEDMGRNRPELLIVESTPPASHLQGFDFLEYFLRDPGFAAEFAAYDPLPNVYRFRVFVRRPSTERPPMHAIPAHATASR
jgi:hypothetical protein